MLQDGTTGIEEEEEEEEEEEDEGGGGYEVDDKRI
jgi:hypothetical protein